MKLASFDIFDTTLIRKCGNPQNVFFLLSKKLFPDSEDLQTDFFMWRRNAEKNAKVRLCKKEVNLNEIYGDFEKQGFNCCSLSKALKCEREMEAQQLVYNKEIKKIISEKRREGYTICFISDMYLDSALLVEVLIREGCAEPNDMIFVSNEYGKTKCDGDLYDVVREYFANIKEWTHYGDNKESDFKKSKKKGIKSVLVKTGFTPNERLVMESYRSYPFGHEISTLIGFQRCARLHLSINDADYENAADYIASTYIPYLDYVFRKAQERGIERLYFLSRDSYILYQLAPLFQKVYPNIECKYFYVSRKALLLPLLKELSGECINNLLGSLGSAKGKTVSEILKLFQLESVVKGDEFSFSKLNNQEEVETFVKVLRQHEMEIMGLQEKAANAQDKYFEQEGVFDDKKIGMVDVGWYGSTRFMINQLRREKGKDSIPFFYLACRHDVLNREFGPYYSFHPYEFNQIERTIIVESYYSLSINSSTIGYKINQSNISKPLFESEYHPEGKNEIVKKNVSVLCEILAYIIEYDTAIFLRAHSVWGDTFMDYFIKNPQNIHYDTFKGLKSYDGKTSIIEKVSFADVIYFLIHNFMTKKCLPNNSMYHTFGKSLGKLLVFAHYLRENIHK